MEKTKLMKMKRRIKTLQKQLGQLAQVRQLKIILGIFQKNNLDTELPRQIVPSLTAKTLCSLDLPS